MLPELNIAIASVKAMTTMVTGASDLIKKTDIALAVTDAVSKLLDAQSAISSLLEEKTRLSARVVELEKEARKKEDFDAKVQNYELRQIAPGVFAQVEKTAVHNPQSAVKLCCQCFGEKRESILQQSNEPARTLGLYCRRCDRKLLFMHYTA